MDLANTIDALAPIFTITSVPCCWFIYSQILKSETSRQHLINQLSKGRVRNLYQQGVSSLLNGLQKLYGDKGSLHAFGISLTIAFFYPLLLWLFAYSYLGASGTVAGAKLLPSQAPNSELVFPVFLLSMLLVVFSPWLSVVFTRQLQLKDIAHSRIVAFVCVAILMVVGIEIGVSYFNVDGKLVFIGMMFGGVLTISNGILSGARAGAVSIGIFASLFFIVLFATNVFDKDMHVSHTYLIFFFVSLPIVNGLLDWLSWWVSRFFLERTAQEPRLTVVVLDITLDLIAGVFFLIVLCLLFSLLAISLDWVFTDLSVRGAKLATTNWHSLAIDARDDPWGKGFMVTMMLITTLLPTLLHICMGFTALLINGIYGKQLAQYLTKNDIENNFYNAIATLWIIVYFAVSILLMAFIWCGLSQLLDIQIAQELYDFILTKDGYNPFN